MITECALSGCLLLARMSPPAHQAPRVRPDDQALVAGWRAHLSPGGGLVPICDIRLVMLKSGSGGAAGVAVRALVRMFTSLLPSFVRNTRLCREPRARRGAGFCGALRRRRASEGRRVRSGAPRWWRSAGNSCRAGAESPQRHARRALSDLLAVFRLSSKCLHRGAVSNERRRLQRSRW